MMAMASLFASTGAAAGTAGAVGSTAAAIGTTAASTSFLGAAGGLTTLAGATGASTGVFGSLTALDVLGGVFDGVSLISGVLGTRSEIAQQEQLGRDRELEALQIGNQATLDEISALEDLRARISQSVVSAQAGGIAPTGSVQSGIEDAVELQEFETQVGGRDARIRQLRAEAEADAARDSTGAILFKGLGEAGSKVFNFFDRESSRGKRRPATSNDRPLSARG